MAVQLISFPFRISQAGSVVTLDDNDEDYYSEQLALLCLTVAGERELVPNYGMTDPTFGRFDRHELQAKIAAFGPAVRILDVKSRYPREGVQQIKLSFDIDPTKEPDVEVDTGEISDEEELNADAIA